MATLDGQRYGRFKQLPISIIDPFSGEAKPERQLAFHFDD